MVPDKEKMLAEEEYEFDADLQCYVNRQAGKIFSKAWIEGKNSNTVQISLSLPHSPTAWKLHLNADQPHEETRNAVYEKYGRKP